MHGHMRNEQVDLMLQHIDLDGDGVVEFVEFLKWWCGAETKASSGMDLVDSVKTPLGTGSGIFLHRDQLTSRTDHITVFAFAVEAALPSKRVNFTLSCEGSENMATQEDGTMSDLTATVLPYQKVLLGSLQQIDPYAGWGLSTRMSWTVSDDPDALRFQNEDLRAGIELAMKAQQSVEQKSGLVPSAEAISVITDTLKNKPSSFVDLEFPPLLTSVADSSSEDDTTKHVMWERCSTFLSDTPQVFQDGDGGMFY